MLDQSAKGEESKKGKGKNKGGRPRKLTKKQVSEAIKDSRANRGIILKVLKVDPSTFTRFLNRHPDLKEQYEQEWEKRKEGYLAMAHTGLHNKLRNEEWNAIRLVLTTLGRKDGFGEGIKIAGQEGDEPVTIIMTPVVNDEKIKPGDE